MLGIPQLQLTAMAVVQLLELRSPGVDVTGLATAEPIAPAPGLGRAGQLRLQCRLQRTTALGRLPWQQLQVAVRLARTHRLAGPEPG